MRKQSLHILKKALLIDGRDNASTIPKTISSEKDSNARGISKKERWANKEAKSLGVGQICSQQELVTNSRQQQWEAFILLHEMLEEYGSHLVDAAWNHQVHSHLMLSQYSSSVYYFIFCSYHCFFNFPSQSFLRFSLRRMSSSPLFYTLPCFFF